MNDPLGNYEVHAGGQPHTIGDMLDEFERGYISSRNGNGIDATGTDLLPYYSQDASSVYQEPPTEPEPIIPVSIRELRRQYPRLKPPLIQGILRLGETCNIIAPTKRCKSWLSYSLALSIVYGIDWLDRFPCEQGRVLLIDNELHPENLASRIPTVADAMEIPPDDYLDKFDTVCLRGQLENYNGIESRLVNNLESGQYQLVVVDAHYRMLPAGISENDNAAMAGIYNLIDEFAARTGAAWVVVHHTSKGNQSEKSITDVGAGAGSQSRAVDSHLILRPHEEDGHFVLDAAVRSWPPVEPLTLKWVFPLWHPSHLDPTRLKSCLTKSEQRQSERDEEGKRQVIDELRNGPGTIRQLVKRTGISFYRLEKLLGLLCSEQMTTSTTTNKRGNETELYELL